MNFYNGSEEMLGPVYSGIQKLEDVIVSQLIFVSISHFSVLSRSIYEIFLSDSPLAVSE